MRIINIQRVLASFIALTFFIGFASFAQAKTGSDWVLNAEQSYLAYTSIKRSSIDVGESQYFKKVSGTVSKNGEVELTINMDSLETNVEQRNERTKEHVFKVKEFPNAMVTADIDMSEFCQMEIGEIRSADIEAKLNLVGVEEHLYIAVNVARLSENKVSVVNRDTVPINASLYGMNAGIDKLVELAGIQSINPIFPVSFYLVFDVKE